MISYLPRRLSRHSPYIPCYISRKLSDTRINLPSFWEEPEHGVATVTSVVGDVSVHQPPQTLANADNKAGRNGALCAAPAGPAIADWRDDLSRNTWISRIAGYKASMDIKSAMVLMASVSTSRILWPVKVNGPVMRLRPLVWSTATFFWRPAAHRPHRMGRMHRVGELRRVHQISLDEGLLFDHVEATPLVRCSIPKRWQPSPERL